jgi:hypothetical protein
MTPRGKIPSLIGSGAGAVKIVTAKGARKCKRCKGPIPARDECAEVGVPGTMGSKTYCIGCYREILQQTARHLSDLEAQVA